MSFYAQVFRILIASPSDVATEREIAVQVIQEWNDLNAAQRQVVLLPLRWETHSAPEYGLRPQEIINRQVVDHCDILIGIFWTRIGSPTGIAESGTIEEIDRIAALEKPVMLYFSQVKPDLEKIDLDQLGRLREFRKNTSPKALIESYQDHVELKTKLARQLEIQLRKLLAKENSERKFNPTETEPVTKIALHFADNLLGNDIGPELNLQTRVLEISDFDEIPDFESVDQDKNSSLSAKEFTSFWLSSVKNTNINKDYYRQRATYLVLHEFFQPVRFWLKNSGTVGARDIHIQLRIRGDKGKLLVVPKAQLTSAPPSPVATGYGLLSNTFPNSPYEILLKHGDTWDTSIDIPVLQPQREISPSVEFLIGAYESQRISISATIFADTLSEPINQELEINIQVSELRVTANDVVTKIIKPEII